MKDKKVYKSGEVHGVCQATQYSQAYQSAHRFLAYRDFSSLIRKFADIKRALDFGSGTGSSTQYLFERGYDAVGIDKKSIHVK